MLTIYKDCWAFFLWKQYNKANFFRIYFVAMDLGNHIQYIYRYDIDGYNLYMGGFAKEPRKWAYFAKYPRFGTFLQNVLNKNLFPRAFSLLRLSPPALPPHALSAAQLFVADHSDSIPTVELR